MLRSIMSGAAFLAAVATAPTADGKASLCDCDPACAERANPMAGQTFADDDHKAWYQHRFWAGTCEGLSFGQWALCWSGESWYAVMQDTLGRAPASEQPALCQRLYRLGLDIGYEWARDNDNRFICTNPHLQHWYEGLRTTDDPLALVDSLEVDVARLRSDRVRCQPD